MASLVFAIQHKTTKCYLLYESKEETCDKDAMQLINSKANKFFEMCPDLNSYKIGDVDFDITIFNELSVKSGAQYDEIAEDDYCMNTNMDKCIEILSKKLATKVKVSKPRAKKAQVIPPEEVQPETKPQPEKQEKKVKPKPKGKRSAVIIDQTTNVVDFN